MGWDAGYAEGLDTGKAEVHDDQDRLFYELTASKDDPERRNAAILDFLTNAYPNRDWARVFPLASNRDVL